MSSIQFWLSSLILSGSMCLIVRGSRVKNITSAVTRQIRSVGFPGGSGMGIFFAISIPLDIPNKAVSLSFYFEANYQLPGDKNSSNFGDYFGERSFDRKLAYQIVENKLERAGYPGRVCLMRAICDAAKNPITNNGLIGDLLHIILTPSSSKNENIGHDIQQAEYEKDCDNRFGGCPVNVLDLITITNNNLHEAFLNGDSNRRAVGIMIPDCFFDTNIDPKVQDIIKMEKSMRL